MALFLLRSFYAMNCCRYQVNRKIFETIEVKLFFSPNTLPFKKAFSKQSMVAILWVTYYQKLSLKPA